MSSINYLDLILGGLLLLFFVRGFLRGAVSELIGLAGFVIGIGVAGNSELRAFIAQQLERVLGGAIEASGALSSASSAGSGDSAWIGLLAYAVAFTVPFFAVSLVGRLLQHILSAAPGLGLVSRLLGAVAGLTKGVVICTLVLIGLQFFAPSSQLKKESIVLPYINAAWSGLSDLTGGAHKLPNFARDYLEY